jgi:hypothetical protein
MTVADSSHSNEILFHAMPDTADRATRIKKDREALPRRKQTGPLVCWT